MDLNHKKIRMVVSDLDGTLLPADKCISDKAVSLIGALRKAGVLFSFVTGRPPYAVKHFVKRVGIDIPVVCCNGAVIAQDDKELETHPFELQPLQNAIQKACVQGMTVLIYADSIEYALSLTDWVKKRRKNGKTIGNSMACSTEAFPLWDFPDFKRNAQKLTIMAGECKKEFSALLPTIKETAHDYSISVYADTGCEIVAPNVDKAFGLQKLCARFGIATDEVLAVGDSANDRSMLQIAGIGAAVNNADTITKSIADYRCKTSYTEGVIEAINKFVKFL